jgi:hypothetical protein
MPFIPELFSAPALARIENRRRARVQGVSFFDGLASGEIDALVGSFAGEPEVHQPVSGRIRGASAFARFVSYTTGWMHDSGVSVEDVDSVRTPSRGVEEFVLHVDGEWGRIEVPMALAADLDAHARMTELRITSAAGLEWPQGGGARARKGEHHRVHVHLPRRATWFELHRITGCYDRWINEYTIPLRRPTP